MDRGPVTAVTIICDLSLGVSSLCSKPCDGHFSSIGLLGSGL
jgi:hypothetical protein